MMSDKCPKCDLELNERFECAQCASTPAHAVLNQTATVAADDETLFPNVLVTSEVMAELDEVVAPWAEPAAGDDAEFIATGGEVQPSPEEFTEPEDSLPTEGDDEWDGAGSLDDATGDDEDVAGGASSATSLRDSARARDIIHASDSSFRWETYVIGQQPKDDDERSLIELTEPLPQRGSNLPEFVSEDLSAYVKKLREERLVLVSCPDEDIAFAAAHALIDGLNLPDGEQRRLLNVERSANEAALLSVYNLRRKGKNDREAVVLVDATTEKARQFLEPVMTAGRAASAVIQDDLRRNDMYILCLVDLAHAEDGSRAEDGRPGRARELKFPCWRIPFLRRLLERHVVGEAAAVEREIAAQRARGWWSPNDSEFYFELKTLLLRGELLGEIEGRKVAPPPGPVNELFKGDDPLSDTVLYVATFFPNLTPYEFNRVVPLMLNGAPRAPHDESAGQSKNGAHAAEAAAQGKDPLQVWRQVPDQVLKKCELVTIPLRDATKGVNFSNHSLRDKLRGHLEREYSFFLENRFQDVQELGLIFSPSSRISQSAVHLSVEMAASYPEYYGNSWLAGVVTDFERSSARAEGTEAQAWRFIQEASAAKARKRFYQSLSELVRAMLDESRLVYVVEEFLQQLLLSKHHEGVLEIVSRLHLAPGFDQFRWLKQLFNRGDHQIREQTSKYLRGYLKRAGVRVYQALGSLESWFPEADRPAHSYSDSAWYALRLSFFYLLETTSRFDTRYYGGWPSAFPLFAFRDAEAAANNLSLLVRLLFHPGMKSVVFQEQRNRSVSASFMRNKIITDWFFILRGKGDEGATRRSDNSLEDESPFDAAVVAGLLLEQLACGAPAPPQDALLTYWREKSRELLKALSDKPYGSKAWEELAWKRNLLIELITSYEQRCGGADAITASRRAT